MKILPLAASAYVLSASLLLSCKEETKSLETLSTQTPQAIESPKTQGDDASSESVGDLLYSRSTLIASVGIPIEPLLVTPGFSGFRSVPNLPQGLNLDPTTGSIAGTPTEATESKVYRIFADRLGRSVTTELPIMIYAAPTVPLAPIADKNFTNTAELNFKWAPTIHNPLGAHTVAYQVQLMKIGENTEPLLLESQKTTANEGKFSVSEEGTYVAKVQSIDALGHSSAFSSLSSPVLVDRTDPNPAQITRVIAAIVGGSLVATVDWSAASDPMGSKPENLTYAVCYEASSTLFVIPSTCESSPSTLPSVTGATSLKLPAITMVRQESSAIQFRVFTLDQAGNKAPSQVYFFQLNVSTGPSAND